MAVTPLQATPSPSSGDFGNFRYFYEVLPTEQSFERLYHCCPALDPPSVSKVHLLASHESRGHDSNRFSLTRIEIRSCFGPNWDPEQSQTDSIQLQLSPMEVESTETKPDHCDVISTVRQTCQRRYNSSKEVRSRQRSALLNGLCACK